MSDTKRWDGPPEEAWSMAWTPQEAARALDGVAAPWAVAGGWAIDLWLGRQTRAHGDLEIAVPAIFYPEIHARLETLGLKLFAMNAGEAIALASGEAPPPGGGHQTWVMDPAVNGWRLDIFREPGDAETWAYHRTGELTAPRAWATGRSADGIPYLVPQVVLLAKAKHQRDKDEADFALVAPRLTPEARDWLIAGLETIHPGHAWIERLRLAGPYSGPPIELPAFLTDGVVTLDAHRLEDAPQVLAGEDGEIARRFDGGRPASLAEAEVWIGQYIDRRAAGGPEVTYALRLPDGTLIGGVEIRRPQAERAEVGYWVFRAFRGAGYARRGLALICQAAAEGIEGLVEIDAHIEPDNLASRRTAEAAGFREVGQAVENGVTRLRLVRSL